MSDVVLIPSACLVPLELQAEFGPIPSAMVPLGGKPAVVQTIDGFLAKGFEAVVAVGENGHTVSEFLERYYKGSVKAVDVGATRSLGETILRTLQSLPSVPERLVINFADTFVEDALEGDDVICAAHSPDLYRWTCFTSKADGRIGRIVEKFQRKSFNETFAIFVGVFQLSRVAEFVAKLERECADSPGKIDPFYRALFEHFNEQKEERRRIQVVKSWYDFGHLDTYSKAKQTYWVNKRFFNEVSIDSGRGIVRKVSSHRRKFQDEINWFIRIPKHLQYVTPRIFDYSLAPEGPFLEMEFYGYPALNDMYLFGQHGLGTWNRILSAVGDALDAMHQCRLRASEPAEHSRLVDSMREMYEVKTKERLRAIVSDARFAPFMGETVEINGTVCHGLEKALDRLPEALAKSGIYDAHEFTILHGDLCLSNILYDVRSGIVRLIDPRGSFGSFDVYGDPRYDLAKLTHSFEGDYDFFVNDQFDLSWTSDGALSFRPYLSERHTLIKQMFSDWLRHRTKKAYSQVRLLESILFLSMVPLHADRPLAQQAFLGTGLRIFHEVFEEIANESRYPSRRQKIAKPHGDHHHGRKRAAIS